MSPWSLPYPVRPLVGARPRTVFLSRVQNPSSDARVYVVIDTVNLRGQSENVGIFLQLACGRVQVYSRDVRVDWVN